MSFFSGQIFILLQTDELNWNSKHIYKLNWKRVKNNPHIAPWRSGLWKSHIFASDWLKWLVLQLIQNRFVRDARSPCTLLPSDWSTGPISSLNDRLIFQLFQNNNNIKQLIYLVRRSLRLQLISILSLYIDVRRGFLSCTPRTLYPAFINYIISENIYKGILPNFP